MTKDKDIKTVVPALRFPEFRDSEAWEVKPLRDIGYFYKGKGLPKSEIVSGGIHQCIHYGELFTEYAEVINRVNRKTNSDNCFLSVSNDVLMPTSDVTPNGLAKACCLNVDNVQLGGDIIVIRTDKSSVDGAFLSRLIRNKEKQVLQLVSGSTVYHLYSSSLEKLAVYMPTLAEQQKIAESFSSLDDLISAVADKIEALKLHKKGLMQQLFPAGGSTTPALRFPEFQNKGGWKIEEFSKYIVLYRGSSPRPIKEYLTQSDTGVNWIKIGDTKFSDNFIMDKVEEKITPEGAKKSRKVTMGELILANSMSFGKTYQLAIDGCIYDGWFVLREYENYFHKPFLLQLLNSEYMQNQYMKLSAGGIVQNISSDIVYQTKLPHTSPQEQRKIAICLSSIDELISAETQKLDQLKAHKKGLMQQLFPSVTE